MTNMNNVLIMKIHNVMKQYIKYICAFLMAVGTSTSAWGESVATSFASYPVVSSSYSYYEDENWYLSMGGGNDRAGFNRSNHTTIGNAFGTAATTTHDGFYLKTKNKLSNICKLTFTYTFCSTASECANAKIYLGYSTDGSSWSAVPLKEGSQGMGVPPSNTENGTPRDGYNETTYTLEFNSISSAYFAVIISRGGSVTADQGFAFSHAVFDFYTGCCDKIVTPAKGTQSNCEIAFDLDEVPTCSSTAADRQVKVKLTPASCYAAPVKASVSSTGTAATWVSGPTWNGTTSTYDYVFQYAQNATGTTTFSASLSTKTTYTVSYNKGSTTYTGGNTISGSHADDTKTCGTNMSLPGVTFTTTGYTQNGWTTSDGGTKVYNLSITNYSVDAAATLYPSWSANETEITLDKNGGTTSGDALVDYGDASVTIVDDAVGASGYHVEGYYTNDATPVKILNADGSYAATNITGYVTGGKWTYTTASTLTLYAHWTTNTYYVRFNKNNGSATGTMADQEFTYGTSQNLTANAFSLAGNVFNGWNTQADGKGTDYTDGQSVNNLTATNNGIFNLYAKWRAASYTDALFSCAELMLTGPTGDLVFITSAASKTVRSQEAFHIEGSGLSASQSITFTHSNSTAASKFAYKKADGTALATDASGEIDTDFYIYYTPASGDTGDGLDEFTNLQAKVTEGLKPKTSNILDSKTVIGRHLPANFVIAAKYDNKWYALPANMAETSHPAPVEIAVDDFNDPSVAYTAASNKYGLEGPASGNISDGNGQYVKLTMSPLSNAPLFGQAPSNTAIGKSGDAIATNKLSEGWWWKLNQTNTSITNSQDAKYTIYCANNNTNHLRLKNNNGNPEWGLYDSGVDELRLIPASSIVFTEAEVVEWGQHSAILEVNATAATGIDATSVIAHLNGASSSAITLSETKTSVKGGDTKYNYTVNFGDGINFAAAASNGAMLTLEWKKGETVKAMSNIIVPKIIANSTSMSSLIATDDPWNTADVHVLPGVTLTANAGDFSSKDVVVDRLEIYPGATVTVTKGAQDVGTLKVRTLVLRNGWTRIGEKAYDVARLYVSSDANLAKNAGDNVWYSDWYIDYDQYYPIAVPWEVDLGGNDGSTLKYKNTKSNAIIGATTGSVRLRYYDGASRASNGQTNIGNSPNWKLYGADGSEAIPAKLQPGKGYAMTAKRPTGKAFSIVRMPLTIPSADWTTGGEHGNVNTTHKDQVSVTAHGDDNTPTYAKGWNLIANPYMSIYQGAISLTPTEGAATTVKFVNIPDVDFKEYDQRSTATATLKPASAFLIQAPKTGTITFGTANRKASAPSYRREETESVPEQQAYILLNGNDAEDEMGILVSDKYTAEYELNADLEKLLSDGNTLRTYMRYNDMNMAYLAINEELAKQLIPVSVRIPADGDYTFRIHEASIADELEGIYLTDYQTNTVTNLLYDSYTFNAVAGTDNARFAINAVIGKREVPTGVDISDSNKDRPTKFIWNDKVYILHNNVIYDSTGKRVNVINK